MSLTRITKIAALIAGVVLLVGASSSQAETADCDRWASPSGSNVNPGTEAAPFRSVAHLIAQLGPGQTGCLTAATFNEPSGTFIVNSTQGTAESPVTVTSADPADPARIIGQMWLKEAADNVVFRGLQFIGSPGSDKSVMLLVGGADGVKFLKNNITFARGICLNIGVLTDRSVNFRLEGNRIHDCGAEITPTGSDSGVHGVYLLNSQDAVIHNNWIYDNKNRGIQHYPNADGTTITNNLLDGNGSNLNLSSESSEGYLSEGILVRDNLISNSDLLALSDPNWPDADSAQVWGYGFGGNPRQPNEGNTHGNLITENCIYQPNATHNFGGWGYAQTNNIFSDPNYTDRSTKNFTLLPASPCAGKGPDPASTPPLQPPETRIIKHPAARTKNTTAAFTFTANDWKASFQCHLDGGPWQSCSSPAEFNKMRPGRHNFAVRAVNAAGPDPSPSRFVWIVQQRQSAKCTASRLGLKRALKFKAMALRRLNSAPTTQKKRQARLNLQTAKGKVVLAERKVRREC